MPIECRPSNVSSDVRCTVCGQGFLLYGNFCSSDQRTVRAAVQQELRRQHDHHDHPPEGFVLNIQLEVPEVLAV